MWFKVKCIELSEGANYRGVPTTRGGNLYGVVIDHDHDLPYHYPPNERDPGQIQYNDRLVGILLTYIEHKGTLNVLAPWPVYTERRLHWAHELEFLIKTLHAGGLVWGDAKPENILVDTMDNFSESPPERAMSFDKCSVERWQFISAVSVVCVENRVKNGQD